ncbi:MAG: undecaprenyldiphospho-muramoylpentapeptide beta-N-acetylglucosaminyltransferase [Gammaproteobacteria bacterium]|jgi:UDP-N-acetylglucosamine--N-acetylmuramyl-(pentapeptide) pyrophosphoryl-undecaprenol N-acetylglucosamine transferase
MTGARRAIVLSAGGTGGHVFPAQSLADALSRRGFPIALITDRRANALGGALAKADTYRINAAGIAGRSLVDRGMAMLQLGVGYFQARRILGAIDPLAVVGFGSYASVPAVLAATSVGAKTVIHEQNAVLGRANRFLAPRVTRIATAFKTVSRLRDEDKAKTVCTGNPVRPEIIAIAQQPYPPIVDGGPINLLVFGGSLGATVFSQVVPETIATLPETLRRRIHLVQQCRAEDLDAVRAIYEKAGVDAELAPFFGDMPVRFANAHLVISRAGASTIAELTAAGRPAILVPYPHATDDHQTKNAESLCDAGGGWLIPQHDFNRETLTTRLTALIGAPRTLQTTAHCAGRMGIRTAADNLADLVVSVIGDGQNGDPQSVLREAAR